MNAKQLTAAETIVMKCIWDADRIDLSGKTLPEKLYPDETCWKNHYL